MQEDMIIEVIADHEDRITKMEYSLKNECMIRQESINSTAAITLDQIAGDIKGFRQEQTLMSERINQMSERIGKLDNRIGSLESNFVVLGNKVETLGGRVHSLENKFDLFSTRGTKLS